MDKPRLLFLIAEYDYFVSHRLSLARAAQQSGFSVHCITGGVPDDTPEIAAGITIHPHKFQRSVRNPLRDVMTLVSLLRLIDSVQPAIIHNVSLKLAALGGLAGYVKRVPAIINAYTGLGYTFNTQGHSTRLTRAMLRPLLNTVSGSATVYSVFQNRQDMRTMQDFLCLDPERTLLIEGSGVDIDQFAPAAQTNAVPTIMFVGRLLLDKGIAEFVQAARQIRQARPGIRFVAVGEPDPENPRSVTPERLSAWKEQADVEFWGVQRDMPGIYAQADIICLPSYHEGLPKVLLEAAACGKPLVSTDIAGCTPVVAHDINGFCVPVADVDALASALGTLISEPGLRARMGKNSRHIVEQRFSSNIINTQFLSLYRELLGTKSRSHLAVP